MFEASLSGPSTMTFRRRIFTLGFVLASLISTLQAQAVNNQSFQKVSAVTVLPQGVELTAGSGKVRVVALSPNVVRVRYAEHGKFPDDHSFAVLPDAFAKISPVKVAQSPGQITLDTGALRVVITKSPLHLAFLDPAGNVISQDQPGATPSFRGNSFHIWKSMPEDEHYFGLGDKTGPLDHRDISFTNWNMDMFGWQESTDPLYKDIPFFLALRQGKAYGIFLDNTYRSNFDFGKEFHDAYSFGAEGGELNYYFFYGPGPKKVIEDFTTLVGRTPLPPLFALGYQQCRYSYYPESMVREIAGEFRKRQIPADIIYLDIDYQQDNRPFTVNAERFPNFRGMVQDLKQEGFKIIAITDLHLAHLPGYKPYDEGHKGDYFVKNPDGSEYVGKVWPGDAVFPDFTRTEVRKWWGTLYKEFTDIGIRGFWNDMNEPALFERLDKTMPLDTVHSVEGRKTDHREIHNVFGMQNARGTHDGLLQLQPDLRPLVLTRAAYAGTQRYAATWTGDNSATWNHMRLSVAQLLSLGVSGYSFVGDDIGGFNGSPTPELLTRWMELGAFNPIYRNHAAKGTRFREPWVDGPEHEAIRKRYIETRYRLLPYIYTGMEASSRTGLPLMRPMFLEFPDEPGLATNGEEYMFGDALLVAPKVWPFLDKYNVTLPKGDWYDYWSGERLQGGRTLQVDPPLDTLPVYVRGGSIVPQQAVVQNMEETPKGPLELRVYPGPHCGGDLYMDDGNTNAYLHGENTRIHFSCNATVSGLEIKSSAPQGPFQPKFQNLQFTVYGLTGKIQSLEVDGKAATGWNQSGTFVALPEIPWAAGPHAIHLTLAAN